MAATGAFKTRPTLALWFFMQVLSKEIKAKQFALNTRYRLVQSGIKIYPECGHHNIHTLLSLACDLCNQPADYTAKQIIFPNSRVEFLYPSKEDWAKNKLSLESYNICAYTDGLANELGVGAGVFVESTIEDQAAILNSDQMQSVSLSKTTTIFQAEMLALSTALTIHNSCVNTSIALITVSMSAMQSLQNPAVRTKNKLPYINQINSVAQSNQLAHIWVPGTHESMVTRKLMKWPTLVLLSKLWALIRHPQSHLATLKPKYVSGQLRNSTTNDLIWLRPVQ